MRQKLMTAMSDLEHVTGEPGDVERDASLAYGEAALTFMDVSFSVTVQDAPGEKSERVILAPVSGHFEPGSLVALMGPSGCGKTTLLDILAKKKTAAYGGVVHLNGRPRDKLFNRVTAYIPQDDVMPVHLTVQEMVTFYQALKVERPKAMSRANVRYFIEERLRVLGLYEVRETKIGGCGSSVRGISGGQRRRVSLACGLSTLAQMFFADEPTSGLSGTDAVASVRYMRLLAKKFGLSLIVTIHQPRPEVATLFDHLVLLTSNPGEVVYNGPMRDARAFCTTVGFPVPEFANPTDHLLDLVSVGGRPRIFAHFYGATSKAAVDDLVEQELNNQRKDAFAMLQSRSAMLNQFGGMPALRNSAYGVGFWRQFQLVLLRQLVLSLRDPMGLGTECAVAVGQALVIGVVYLDVGLKASYYQMLFFFMLVMTTALVGMKVMPKLVDERVVIKKETSEALYSDWAYILSFSLINGVSAILGNLIFITLVFWMSGCPWELYECLLLWTTALCLVMNSLYTMVAAVAKDSTGAMTISLPFLTVCLLYNNFTVYRESLPDFMAWLLKLSPVAYTMEAIAIKASKVSPGFSVLVQQFHYEDEFGHAVGAMCGCWLVFQVAQVVCFKNLNNLSK